MRMYICVCCPCRCTCTSSSLSLSASLSLSLSDSLCLYSVCLSVCLAAYLCLCARAYMLSLHVGWLLLTLVDSLGARRQHVALACKCARRIALETGAGPQGAARMVSALAKFSPPEEVLRLVAEFGAVSEEGTFV